MKILLVEDEVRLAKALAHILESARYQVDMVHDGQSGLDWALCGTYDVIILDIMLPKLDGLSVASELRRKKIATPIMMLTAKSEVEDKIQGLDSGADDYMTKPFSSAELLAHVRALTRRTGEVQFEELSFADLTLNLQSYYLSANGKTIHLSYKEFCLFKVLIANPRMTISKETLLEKVWGGAENTEENSVETYISFLRKKLTFLESNTKIETLRKAGYRLVEAQE